MNDPIPFLDLKSQVHNLQKEIAPAMQRVLDSGKFVGGEEIEKFELEFANYLSSKYVVGVNSGTDALILGIRGLGLKTGDEVILPANTFIATAAGVIENGLKPVLVDIDENDYGINLDDLRKKINERTKAIIAVHLYGQPDKIFEIKQIIKQTNKKIYLIEDACQAHGSYYGNKRVGNFGIFSAFSFYPGKNLGAYGDGGAIVTNDSRLSKKYKMLRDHGQQKKYRHEILGINSRLDSLQAAILRVKLKHLDEWNEKRRENALFLTASLNSELPFIITPKEFEKRKSVYHVYVVRARERNKLLSFLASQNIGALIHYPIPLYRQKALSNFNYNPKDFPSTEKTSREIISLPMFPELTRDMMNRVVYNLGLFYGKK